MRTSVAAVLLCIGLALSATGRSQGNDGSRNTLPPESCAPPPLGHQELLAAASNDGILQWSSDLGDALKGAKAKQQEVLLYFRSADCMDCNRMQAVTVADSYIQTRLSTFALVRMDRDANLETARKYGITTVPALVRLSSEGTVIRKHSGFLEKDGLLEFLRHNASPTPANRM